MIDSIAVVRLRSMMYHHFRWGTVRCKINLPIRDVTLRLNVRGGNPPETPACTLSWKKLSCMGHRCPMTERMTWSYSVKYRSPWMTFYPQNKQTADPLPRLDSIASIYTLIILILRLQYDEYGTRG